MEQHFRVKDQISEEKWKKKTQTFVDVLQNRKWHLFAFFRQTTDFMWFRDIYYVDQSMGSCYLKHWIAKYTMDPIGAKFHLKTERSNELSELISLT